MDAELDHVVTLELELLTPDCRGDRSRVDQLLHPEFVEHGASGRTWTRLDTLDDLEADPWYEGTAIDIAAARLSADVVLITYRITGSRPSLRSSLWVRGSDGWRMRFCQGTLTS